MIMKRQFDLEPTIEMEENGEHASVHIREGGIEILIFRKGKLVKRCVMPKKSMELFGVNILKSIVSKRVLQGKIPYWKRVRK